MRRRPPLQRQRRIPHVINPAAVGNAIFVGLESIIIRGSGVRLSRAADDECVAQATVANEACFKNSRRLASIVVVFSRELRLQVRDVVSAIARDGIVSTQVRLPHDDCGDFSDRLGNRHCQLAVLNIHGNV